MKKYYFAFLGVSVLLFLAGCSHKPKPATANNFACTQDGVKAPSWTCMPQGSSGMIVGLGSAPLSGAGINFTRVNALAQARNDLAFKIQTDVKAKVAQFARSTGIKNQEAVDAVSTQVSQQLAQQNLRDSKQIKSWQNPKDGTLFILVAMPIKEINNGIKKQITSSSYNNKNALWQQFQSKEALKQLNRNFPTN